MTDQSD